MPNSVRDVTYKRYEHTAAMVGDEDTTHTGTLLTFVYDIPYFDACGVFPPLHIANQIFLRGEAGGGMSPGTSWEPFSISDNEYRALAELVQNTPVEDIKPHARYAYAKMKFDHSLDTFEAWLDWVKACCEKHRQARHEELRKAGAMS
jgi:hypothetical protein